MHQYAKFLKNEQTVFNFFAFGVNLHERTIGKYLAKHGFHRLSVRPEHPKTDPAAQQAFKKTLPAS